ncbi:MAG: hypothetical protein PHQ81_07815 [Methanofollis sp.]|nr:hypothetical protein [Methanofollis sp.]
MPSDISRIFDPVPYDFNSRRDYQILVREVLGIYSTPPGIDDLVDLLIAAPDRERQRAAAICLQATGEKCIEPLYERAEGGDLREQALCLGVLTGVPDPDLGEKVEFLRTVLTCADDDPAMKAAGARLSSLGVRAVIPLLHLQRLDAAASPDLRMKVNRLLVQIGEVVIAPAIQLFRYDDPVYFESVLPVLRSLAPGSVKGLEEAKETGGASIRRDASRALDAVQGKGTRARVPSGETMVSVVEMDAIPSPEYGTFCPEHYDDLYDLVE